MLLLGAWSARRCRGFTASRQQPTVRQPVRQLLCRQRIAKREQPRQRLSQVGERVDAQVLTRPHDAVQRRRRPTPFRAATELPVGATHDDLAKRPLRQVVVGRANWQFCGSAEGGRTAAALYSVVGTCKHLGIDPFAYLREALPALFGLGEGELTPWLPDVWQVRQRQSASRLGASQAGGDPG